MRKRAINLGQDYVRVWPGTVFFRRRCCHETELDDSWACNLIICRLCYLSRGTPPESDVGLEADLNVIGEKGCGCTEREMGKQEKRFGAIDGTNLNLIENVPFVDGDGSTLDGKFSIHRWRGLNLDSDIDVVPEEPQEGAIPDRYAMVLPHPHIGLPGPPPREFQPPTTPPKSPHSVNVNSHPLRCMI